MNDAEKFDWLRYAVEGALSDKWDEVNPDDLMDLIDTMEERWELWEK